MRLRLDLDLCFKIVVVVGFLVFNGMYTPHESYAGQAMYGRVSLFVSMLFLVFGRGVFASNVGMAIFVLSMFLLLLG